VSLSQSFLTKPSLSLVIVALNEERTIGKTIEAALPVAQEIIVVDSGSTDGTVQIAQSLGARVVHQDWLGYAAQKNFAMDLAVNDWILSLDADEIMTPDLVSEIVALLSLEQARNFDGYKIPRVLYIGTAPVKHGGFYPDAQLRLVQRGRGRFNDRLVHEAIKVNGAVKTLSNHMDHYSYTDVAQFQAVMEKYARLSAAEFARSNKKKGIWKTSSVNEILHPLWTFLYRYVLRQGYLDGGLGLRLALIYCSYVRNKIKYFREYSG
jgi:glycosyltransferase involved in cell wall biosynthesis